MKARLGCVVVGFLSLVLSLAAQTSGSNPASAQVPPPLVNFSGMLTDVNSKPLTGVVGVTFSLYQEQQGGSPLWLETQNVRPNSTGHYTVVLGSATSQGIPANLFASGEARWLGVQVQGQPEQPRVLLVSAPYALKAGDAETLGGKPASAFMAASGNAASGNNVIANTVTGTGTPDYVPLWLTKSKLGSSKLFQSTAGDLGIGTTAPAANLDVNGTSDIRNTLTLFPNGSAPTLSINGTAFSISKTGTVSFVSGQTFPGTGTVTSVGSGAGLTGGPITKSGTLSIAAGGVTNAMLQNSSLTVTANSPLSGGGAVSLGGSTSLGLKSCSANQILQFVSGAWACANPGNGTVTSVGTGLGLKGGPITTSGTLTIDTTVVPQLSAANTFTGNQTINGTLTATGAVSASGFAIGSSLFAFGSYNSGNAFVGFAGNTANSGFDNTATGAFALGGYSAGSYNTASGASALYNNQSGYDNTATGYYALTQNSTGNDNEASGYFALFLNGSGAYNTASGSLALQANTTGNYNTAIGNNAGATADTSYVTGSANTLVGASAALGTGTLTNATAIGANAQVNESNALVLGSLGTNVGIGATFPQAALDVAGYQLETFIGNPGCGAHPFAGIAFGTTGFQNCGNYSMVGDSVNTYIAAPTGDIYFRTQSNRFAAMTIDPSGNVNIAGNLSKGGGSFKIDHPLDPANKYLYHSFVESPDMMNVYNGNIITNKRGLATVVLPDYFEALNRDFRYQLTVIGRFAQAIVAREISGNRFTIRTSKPGVKVSWQVTGVRHDAYADAHRIQVEVEKPPQEQGHYLHPELYGAGPEQTVSYHVPPVPAQAPKQAQTAQVSTLGAPPAPMR